MRKKTTHFLNISLVLVTLFCILIFIIQTICMNLLGENAIRHMGIFYMKGISEQVSSHFGTAIELRLAQVESLVDSVPPGRFTEEKARQISLTYNARVDKTAGGGMGMTITKYIVDAMGGTITVESEQGKGSHFHITVDMEKAVHHEKKLHLPKRNVLVIDDDETACSLAVSSLESIGLQAEFAAGIEQALPMIEKHHGKNEQYHIILARTAWWQMLAKIGDGTDISEAAKEFSSQVTAGN